MHNLRYPIPRFKTMVPGTQMMSSIRWKENRQGAVSLCYFQPSEETLAWVAASHFAVGIRATLINPPKSFLVPEITHKNWEICAALQPEWKTDTLPNNVELAKIAIDSVVSAGGWTSWFVNLDIWTASTHRSLLSWLGDHHARIWCAPHRDISDWVTASRSQFRST